MYKYKRKFKRSVGTSRYRRRLTGTVTPSPNRHRHFDDNDEDMHDAEVQAQRRRKRAQRDYNKQSNRRKKMYVKAKFGPATKARVVVNRTAVIPSKVTERRYVDKCLQKILYPHSRSTIIPKVPDGSVGRSIGREFHGRLDFTMATSQALIVQWPGLCCSATVHDLSDDGTQVLTWNSISNPNHGRFFVRAAGDPVGYALRMKQFHIDKWRIVSQGMRIIPRGDGDENSGQYRVYRGNTESVETLRLEYDNGVVDANNRLTDTITPIYFTIPSLGSQNTTQTGSGLFKQIGKQYFRLGNESSSNKWTSLQSFSFIKKGHLGTIFDLNLDTFYVDVNEQDGNETNRPFFDEVFSKDHDVVMVRIIAAPGNQFSVDLVQNQEFTLQHDSELKIYETNGATRTPQLAQVQRTVNEKTRRNI